MFAIAWRYLAENIEGNALRYWGQEKSPYWNLEPFRYINCLGVYEEIEPNWMAECMRQVVNISAYLYGFLQKEISYPIFLKAGDCTWKDWPKSDIMRE